MGMQRVPTLGLSLLRGFTLTVDQRKVPMVWSAQRLVAYLALNGRPLTRSAVGGALWPETTGLKANANLRSSLFRVQQACGSLVDTSAQQLNLADGVVVDVLAARADASRLLDRPTACDEILTSATTRNLSADLLPDWYDEEWVLTEREQHRQLRLYALEALCERLTAAGRFGEAVDAGLAAVRAEPLRESGHQALIKAHLAAGNRWEAVRQYERCRRLLHEELGLKPSPALSKLLPVHVVGYRLPDRPQTRSGRTI
jgi:DNA-binding SARP family transcriptional activator